MRAAQGQQRGPIQPATRADVLTAIRRIGVLQIDMIHATARSPYLGRWSRLGDYRPEWLDARLAEGALLKDWAHGMCFLPSTHY